MLNTKRLMHKANASRFCIKGSELCIER